MLGVDGFPVAQDDWRDGERGNDLSYDYLYLIKARDLIEDRGVHVDTALAVNRVAEASVELWGNFCH